MGLPSTCQDLGGPKIIFAYSKGENDPKIIFGPRMTSQFIILWRLNPTLKCQGRVWLAWPSQRASVSHQSLGASRCRVFLYFPDNFIHLGSEQHTPFDETFPVAVAPNAPVSLDGRDAVCSSRSRNGPSAVVCCSLRSMTSWCSEDLKVRTLCVQVMGRSSPEAAKVRSQATQKRQMCLVNRWLLL